VDGPSQVESYYLGPEKRILSLQIIDRFCMERIRKILRTGSKAKPAFRPKG